MKPNKLRFAVIGVGRIGKIHIASLVRRIPEAEVTMLVDNRADELARVAGMFQIRGTAASYSEALERPDFDAVVVCTPTDTHHQIISQAAAAGKHIFCEKPLDLSLAGVQEIQEEVQSAGVRLMVGFNRRFDANFLKLHEMVRAGKIGAPHILRITSRDPAPPPEGYLRGSGGLFLDMTIHDFDMARHLVGSEVTEVYARAGVLIDPMFARAGDWDTAVTTLSFQNGALGVIDNSRRAVYGYDQRIEVFGSDGMVAVENNKPDNHVYSDRWGTHTSLPLNFFMDRYRESYFNEMRSFVDAVLENGPVPVDANDSRMALGIGLAAMKSVEEIRPVKMNEIMIGTHEVPGARPV